jgi:hypothetical protein
MLEPLYQLHAARLKLLLRPAAAQLPATLLLLIARWRSTPCRRLC